jgi:hypothetical protein
MNFKILSLSIVIMLLLSGALIIAPQNEVEAADSDFFQPWLKSMSPVIQAFTGTNDSADVFYNKLMASGASFNDGIAYIGAHGTEKNYNHLSWDAMAYMWEFIALAYPSTLPEDAWVDMEDILQGMGISRDNFYTDLILTDLVFDLTDQEIAAINTGLLNLYNYLHKSNVSSNDIIIIVFILVIFAIMASLDRSMGFNGTIFIGALCINLTIAIWANVIEMVFIVVPIILMAILVFTTFKGGSK